MARMDDAEGCLANAELAIRTGDVATAAREINALEGIFSQATPASEGLDVMRARIQRLMALVTAAAEGTAAAHRWLEDALKLANTLETYTADGRRSVDILPATKAERF